MANAPAFAFLDEQHCEVAYGVGNCFKATDGNWYARSALVTAIAPANAPGLDLNPVSLVQSALHDLTGPVSTVEQWVLKQLVKLGALISTDLEKAKGYTVQLIDGVGARIDHLAGQVNSVIGSIGGDMDRALAGLRHDVAADVDAAVGPVSSALDTARHDIAHWSDVAAHYTDDALTAFNRDVFLPAIHDLNATIDDLQKASAWVWQVFVPQAIAPVGHDASEAQHAASKAIYWIDHSGMDAVHLIDECWDWLEAFAAHPFTELESLPGRIRTALPGAWTEAAAEPATATIDKIVDWLNEELPNV